MNSMALRGTAALAAVLLTTAAANASLVVSKRPTNNVACTAGVCSATAPHAVLNAHDLKSMLGAGDVTVQSGSIARDIAFDAALAWTSSSRLTLDAAHSIAISKAIQARGTGAVTLTTNDGGSGGDLSFAGPGRIDFWDTASSLVVNANAYTLVDSLPLLGFDVHSDPSGFYALASDYDASADGTYDAPPVSTGVSGVVEGLGHAVSNFHLDEFGVATNQGMFAIVETLGTVRDLSLHSVTMSVDAHNHAAVVAGGLVGMNNGTVHRCAIDGTVGGRLVRDLGGLVGFNAGTVDYSSSAASVASGFNVGGLVGASVSGAIRFSSATGSVGGNASVGGLVGINFSPIDSSFATGDVNGIKLTGGLAGWNDNAAIVNSYATGTVQGATTGGLAGRSNNGAMVASSYAIGAVSGTGPVGSFFGNSNMRNSSSDYWDTDSSGPFSGCGIGSCEGVSGLTTAAFQSGLPAGFDPTVWAESPSINGGFPYLLANPPH